MRSQSPALPKPEFNSTDRGFQQELNQRVSAYFRENGFSPKAPLRLKIKALGLYSVLFFFFFSFFLFEQNFYSVAATALAIVSMIFLVGMNVMHDCAHGTYFKNPTLSRLGYCVWDFFGVSGDMYRVKHLQAHHNFTNITGWDGDMDLSYPVLRLNPNLPCLPRHRYQVFYAPVLYGLLTLSWLFLADFAALATLKVCNFDVKPFAKRTIAKIVAFKFLTIFLFIVIPSFYFPVPNVVGVFVFVQLGSGFLLALFFQLAHINEKASFVKSESGQVADDWAVHQLATTTNFATGSRFWRFVMGGLNYQIEHHLFPSVSHAHYPAIQKIVQGLCAEKKIPYLEYPTFLSAASSHFRLLKKLGQS